MDDSARVPESRVEESSSLSKAIGPRLLLLFIIGDMLGTGIYVRVGAVAGEVGGAVWVSFLVAFILAGLTAFSYAELVTKYPGAAGAALYTNRAFRNPLFSFIVAFAVICSGLASAAAAARAFGGDYLAQFVSLPALLVAMLFVIVLSTINFIGISESFKVNLVLTLIELSGLLIIILIGGIALFGGTAEPTRPFEFSAGDAGVPLAILTGASVAFYALIGFEDSVNVAEETENPSRTFPLALFAGIAITGVVYLLVAFTATMVVSPERLAGEETAPLRLVLTEGPLAFPPQLFAVIALVAITNTALANLIMSSRVLYGMSREGVLPSVFSKVHRGRRTPWVAILFVAVVMLALVTTGTVSDLANQTVVLLLLVFIVVNVAVLVLRRERVDHDHFRTPSAIPVIGIVIIIVLLVQQEGQIFLRAGIVLLVGLVLYLINYFVKRGLDRETPR
ncbi:MAG TPA: APC family permease [Rubrobacteraceae bacterium]|nr:APC family permease [Rubrobacteraceae bacterium]